MGECIDITQLLGAQREQMTAKQAQIIEAAVTLFSEKGYAATSTREIAVRAGVAEGTVFKQYATKESLFASVIAMVIDNILYPFISSDLEQVLLQPYGSLEEALRAILRNRLALLSSGRVPMSALKLVIQELPFRPEIQQQLSMLLRQMPLEQAIRRWQQQGLVVDWPERTVSRLLLSSLLGFLTTRFILAPQYFAGDLEADITYWVAFMSKALVSEGGER